MKPGRFGNTLSIGLHIQVTLDPWGEGLSRG